MKKWTMDDFPITLDNLKPKAREKAVEIANQLMESGEYSQDEAIQEAIKRAEEWFLESEG